MFLFFMFVEHLLDSVEQIMSPTSIHDQIPSDFRLPVVPGGLKALGEADAEILEVAFAY